MKKENLEVFMSKINYDKKNNYIEYIDNEIGRRYSLKIDHIMPVLDYIKATDDELSQLIFDMKIEKGIEFNKIKEERPFPLYKDTQKEEDKSVIVNKEFNINQIWNVSNPLGIFKTFNNKEDATKFYEKIRNELMSNME
jgi:uncharacterized protein YpiB (UPF0302 family)